MNTFLVKTRHPLALLYNHQAHRRRRRRRHRHRPTPPCVGPLPRAADPLWPQAPLPHPAPHRRPPLHMAPPRQLAPPDPDRALAHARVVPPSVGAGEPPHLDRPRAARAAGAQLHAPAHQGRAAGDAQLHDHRRHVDRRRDAHGPAQGVSRPGARTRARARVPSCRRAV
eukprot:7232311-Prymnesium_polylepis.1